jgi:hypothetical protein
MISHTCNPIYSRSRDLGDGNSRLAWKKVKWDPISTNKLGVVVHNCNLSYIEV